MKKINLKLLFLLLFGIPFLIILGLTGYNAYQSYMQYKLAQKGEKASILLKDITSLVKSLGEERGVTSIALATNGNYKRNGKNITQILKEKRLISDKNINEFLTDLTKYPILPKKVVEKWTYQLNQIKNVRKEIDNKLSNHIAVDANFYNYVFNTYTKVTRNLLKDELKFFKVVPKNIQKYVMLNSRLGLSLDNFGIIRGKTVGYVAAGVPMSKKTYKDIYIEKLIDPKILPIAIGGPKLIKIYSSKEYKKSRNDVNNMIFTIEHFLQIYYHEKEHNPNAEFYGYPYEAFQIFNTISNYINLINKSDNVLLFKMDKDIAAFKAKKLEELFLNGTLLVTVLVLLLILFVVKSKIEEYIESFEALLYRLSDLSEDSEKNKQNDDKLNIQTLEGMEQGIEILEKAIKRAKEQKEKAEESVKAKSLFLANMSHEIRTPLNGILGFLEILQTTPLNEDQKHFVATVEQSAKNLLQIVNNILDVSKIESNKVEIELIPFKFEEEIENTLSIHATPTAQKDIKYVTKVSPNIPKVVKGDIVKIKEILNNLLSNAIKFTPRGGEIDVTIENRGVVDNKVKIYFEVKDSGIGMTPSQKEKVFQPFTQADESVTRKFGGTGLGLTIVKSYIEMMGGKIEVESEPNKGTKFFFEIEFEIENPEPTYKENIFADKHFAILVTDRSSLRKITVLDYFNYFGIKTTPVVDLEEYEKMGGNNNFEGIVLFYEETSKAKLKEITKNEKIFKIIFAQINNKVEIKANNAEIVFDPVLPGKVFRAIKAKEKSKLEQTAHKEIQFDRSIEGLRALIVEDNVVNQALLKKVLEKFGVQSEIANDGLEGYNKYTMNPDKYDVIFMDKQMPKMDGIETTQEILEFEKEEGIPHTPIIALTANAMQGDREELLAAGMDDYLSKPVKMDLIEKVLQKVAKGEYLGEEDIQKLLEQKTEDNKNVKQDVKELEKEDDGKYLGIIYTDSDFVEMVLRDELEPYKNIELYRCFDKECVQKHLDKKFDFSKIFLITSVLNKDVEKLIHEHKGKVFFVGDVHELKDKDVDGAFELTEEEIEKMIKRMNDE